MIKIQGSSPRRWSVLVLGLGIFVLAAAVTPAQQWVTGTRDPGQTQDEEFAKLYTEWTGEPRFGSPLVDHLPAVEGIPTPNDVLGHHVGAPVGSDHLPITVELRVSLEP